MANFFDRFDGQAPAFAPQGGGDGQSRAPARNHNAPNPFDQYDDEPPALGVRVAPKTASAPDFVLPSDMPTAAPASDDAPDFVLPSEMAPSLPASPDRADTVPAIGSDQSRAQQEAIGNPGLYLTPNEAQQAVESSKAPFFSSKYWEVPGGWAGAKRRVGQVIGDVGRSAGSLFGLGDRASAAIDTMAGTGSSPDYQGNLAAEQRRTSDASQRLGMLNPVLKGTGDTMAAAAVLPEALLGAGVGSIYSKLGYGATGGALIGGTEGAASSPAGSSWGDIGKNAAIGGGAGGVLGAAAPAVIEGVGAARNALDSIIPMTRGSIQRVAGNRLANAAENPNAVIAGADTPTAEIIPGSQPTVGQLTGDRGLLNMERSVSRANALPFIDRAEQQNAARVAALNALQSEGDPAAVGSFFRQQLDDIDRNTQQALDAATQNAQGKVATLPGAAPTEDIGAQARGALENSVAAMRDQERSLWSAVPKDVSVVSSPMKEALQNTYGSITPEIASTLTPVEREVAGFVSGYGDQLPFDRLNGLRQVVNLGLRDARSPLQPNEAAYARLSQMRGSIDDAIQASLTSRAAQDQAAVASGQMSVEDTMLANMQRQQRAWYDARASQAEAVGQNPSTLNGAAANGSGGRGGFSPASGAAVSGRGKSGISQGTQSVSGAESPPLIDQAGADALNAATAATKARKELVAQQPVSGLLQRPSTTAPYKISDASVPGKIWRPGVSGQNSVNTYLAATKASPESIDAVRQAAASSLRDEVQDGILSPQALEKWRAKYAEPLSQLEKNAPGTTKAFEDAASAGKAVEDASIARKGQLDAYQKSTMGDLLKLDSPDDITKRIGTILKGQGSVQKMHALAEEAAKDPNALAGLRRSMAEYIQQNLLSNTEVGTSGLRGIKVDQFQTFVRKNDAALRQVFTKDEADMLHGIAADLQRSARANATKITGGSDTVQNMHGAAQHSGGAGGSILGAVIGEHAGEMIGHRLLGGLGGAVVGAIRRAGIANTNELVTEALLNPKLARELMMKAPSMRGHDISTANRIFRAMVPTVPTSMVPALQRDGRKSGGRVGKSHEFLVNRLIKLSELAKKDQVAATKPLLGAPDELVVHALKLINRGV